MMILLHISHQKELVERVKAYGGKFLKRDQDGLWYDMNEEVAREKASQGEFTCLRLSIKRLDFI